MATARTATGLYYEVRGSGPAVLLIPGAGGDGGVFARSAERLADEFSVITYDRRGNSRSPVEGEAQAAATMRAQAADAAALIRECGYERAVVYGNSGGGIIALELLALDASVVKGMIVHEPPLFAVLPHHDGPNPMQPILDLAGRDPRAALAEFLRVNVGETALAAADAATRDRMLGNGEALFKHEIREFLAYRPDETILHGLPVPLVLLRGSEGLDFAPLTLAWLAERSGVRPGILTGGHCPFLDVADVFAEELRPILRELWAAVSS